MRNDYFSKENEWNRDVESYHRYKKMVSLAKKINSHSFSYWEEAMVRVQAKWPNHKMDD